MYFDQQGGNVPRPEDPAGEESSTEESVVSDFDLRDAAEAARSESDSAERIKTIFESEVFGLEVRRREEGARARYRRMPHIQGVLRVGVHAKAFEANRSKTLSEMYPIDERSGLRWLEVRLDEGLPAVGVKTAEKVLQFAND